MNNFIWDSLIQSPEMNNIFNGKPRVYADGGSRDNLLAPYIVWTNITESPTLGVGAKALSSRHRVQFDIYSRDTREVSEIGQCLEKVFMGRGVPLLRMGPLPEVGTKLYRRTIDMSFIVKGN